MAEAPRNNEAEAAAREEIRKKLESRERKYSNLADSRSRLLSERDQINYHSGNISREEEKPWKATWDSPDVQKKDHRGWNASIESKDSVVRDEASAENIRYEKVKRALNRISKQLLRTQQELSQLYYELEGNNAPNASETVSDDSEKIVPYQPQSTQIIRPELQDESIVPFKDEESDKLAKNDDYSIDEKITPVSQSDVDVKLIPNDAKNEEITVASETGEVGIEPATYTEDLGITLADINPEDIIINIEGRDLEPSPDLPDYKKEALRFINELAKRDQERAVVRYGGFKPFSALTGALRMMSAAKVPFTKYRPFEKAAGLASSIEKVDQKISEGPVGRAIGKIRGWFDRVGQRKTLTDEQIANDTEIDQNLAQVGNFNKNQWWKRPLKTAAKVMGGFGVAGAMVMTGGVGAATSLLWAGGLKEGYDGIGQSIEQIGWGRKRAKAELDTQSLMSQAVDELKARISSGEQITPEEYQRLTEEVLQREERLMATQEMNVYGEKKGQQIRSIATSALTLGTGLLAGVPMGKINYDTNNTALANTLHQSGALPQGTPVMAEQHRGFWNLLKGGQFGYEHNGVLSAVKDSYDGVAGGMEYDKMQSFVNMFNNMKGQPFGTFSLTPTSVYGQTSHILGQGLLAADKLKIGAAGAYLLGETLRHFQGKKVAKSVEPAQDTPTDATPPSNKIISTHTDQGNGADTGADKESPNINIVSTAPTEGPTPEPISSEVLEKIQPTNQTSSSISPAEAMSHREPLQAKKAEVQSVQEINDEESSKILEGLSLNDVEFNGRKLSTDQIKEFGLAPRHKVTQEGKTMWFSENTFSYDVVKNAGLAFFEQNGKYSVLPYMSSASQGVYRLYPGFTVSGTSKEYISWYSKGWGEQGLMLPVGFQKALSELPSGNSSLNKEDAQLVLVGSSNKYSNDAEAMAKGGMLLGVEAKPVNISGISEMKVKNLDNKAESISFNNAEDSPNFDEAVTSWRARDPLYGEVRYDAFDSKNGMFRFLFCQDSRGRAWIGGVENLRSPIGDNGLRQESVDAGILATPAYEYPKQLIDRDRSINYGNPQESAMGGLYVDAYQNLLRKIPVIQEYQRAINEEEDDDELGEFDQAA